MQDIAVKTSFKKSFHIFEYDFARNTTENVPFETYENPEEAEFLSEEIDENIEEEIVNTRQKSFFFLSQIVFFFRNTTVIRMILQ